LSLGKTIAVAAVVNSASYAIWYATHRAECGVDIFDISVGQPGGGVIYLVGGCLSRTAKPFQFVMDQIGQKIPADTSIHYIEYRNRGLNVAAARRAIKEHIDKHDYRQITFVAVSMGYQLIMGVARESDKVIGLNPCVGALSLSPKMRRLVSALPAVAVISAAFGWLMQLPIVKVDGPAYSPRLLLDQLAVCASSAHSKFGFRPDVLVVSIYDELVDNVALQRLATQGERRRSVGGILTGKLKRPMELKELPTDHFGVGENHYRYAVIVPFLVDGSPAK
jgi:hypothetical protein